MIKQQRFIYLLFPFLFYSCALFNKTQKIKLEANFSDAQELVKEIRVEDLMANLSVLSSDSLEGRETTKPGQKKAADFIKKQLISYGVLPTKTGDYFQKFNVSVIDFNRVALAINGKTLKRINDFYLFLSLIHI